METLYGHSQCTTEYLNCQDLCSDSFHWKNRLTGSGILKRRGPSKHYNCWQLCFVIMPAHYLIYMEICVLLQHILKIHPKGMAQPLKKLPHQPNSGFGVLSYIAFLLIWFLSFSAPSSQEDRGLSRRNPSIHGSISSIRSSTERYANSPDQVERILVQVSIRNCFVLDLEGFVVQNVVTLRQCEEWTFDIALNQKETFKITLIAFTQQMKYKNMNAICGSRENFVNCKLGQIIQLRKSIQKKFGISFEIWTFTQLTYWCTIQHNFWLFIVRAVKRLLKNCWMMILKDLNNC